MARRRKTQMELPTTALEGDGVDAHVTSGESVEVQETAPVLSWRVAKTAKVSLFGQLTTLTAGSKVTLADYGRAGIDRLATQVELVPE